MSPCAVFARKGPKKSSCNPFCFLLAFRLALPDTMYYVNLGGPISNKKQTQNHDSKTSNNNPETRGWTPRRSSRASCRGWPQNVLCSVLLSGRKDTPYCPFLRPRLFPRLPCLRSYSSSSRRRWQRVPLGQFRLLGINQTPRGRSACFGRLKHGTKEKRTDSRGDFPAR